MADDEARFGRWCGGWMLPSLPPATTGNLKITGPLERKVDEHRGYIHVVQNPSRFSNFPAVSDVLIKHRFGTMCHCGSFFKSFR